MSAITYQQLQDWYRIPRQALAYAVRLGELKPVPGRGVRFDQQEAAEWVYAYWHSVYGGSDDGEEQESTRA